MKPQPSTPGYRFGTRIQNDEVVCCHSHTPFRPKCLSFPPSHSKMQLVTTAEEHQRLWCVQTQQPGTRVRNLKHKDVTELSPRAACFADQNHGFRTSWSRKSTRKSSPCGKWTRSSPWQASASMFTLAFWSTIRLHAYKDRSLESTNHNSLFSIFCF